MNTSNIEALASIWARIAEETEFPTDYEGTATPAAHQASVAIFWKAAACVSDSGGFICCPFLGHCTSSDQHNSECTIIAH